MATRYVFPTDVEGNVWEGSPKSFAAAAGLCNPGRGRMGADAQAYVDAAIEAGWTFKAPVVTREPAAKAVVIDGVTSTPAPRVAAIPKGDYDPKAARAWAEQNGLIEAGKRGRIATEVVAAFLAAHSDNPAAVARPAVSVRTPKVEGEVASRPRVSASTVIGNAGPRTSAKGTKWGQIVNGKPFTVSSHEVCVSSGYSIDYCPCGAGTHNVVSSISPSGLFTVQPI